LWLSLDVITTAAILFTVATGLLIVFGVMKIVNFAHGAFITLGAMRDWWRAISACCPGSACRWAFSPVRPAAPWWSRSWCVRSTAARWTPSWPPGASASSSASC
jgi:branched-subunit amino acid ABC-type transport system permease component